MARPVSLVRGVLAVGAGVLTVLILVFGTILLFLPQWAEPDGFPVSRSGLSALLLIEVLAGGAGAFVTASLAPRAPAAHGIILGALVLVLNGLTVLDPASSWPLVPAVLLIVFVPLQTWLGIALAIRVRSRQAQPPNPGMTYPAD
jgi:hypothetical protein